MRDVKNYTLLNAAAPRAITSSTNASPIEITMAAPHGYATGQKVTVAGHLVNTAANGSWEITVTGASTFELNGSVGNGVGGATGTLAPKSKYAYCDDFRNVVLAIDTGVTSTLTVKLVGSIQDTPPDFAAPQSPTNQWDYVQMLDLDTSTEVDGNVGIPLAAATLHKMYEANINGVRWLAAILPAGTAGDITVKARLFNE